MNKTIAIIVAHPDDEALGCGGSIAKHVASGDDVHVLFLADGVTSRGNITGNAYDERMDAANAAQTVLGVKSIINFGFPDNRMDNVPLIDIVQTLEKSLAKIGPQIIYTHHAGDLNVDHRICSQAVMTACRPMPGSVVERIVTFEVLSSTEWGFPGLEPFIPNHFVDITQYIDKKVAALHAYATEMRQAPHSRSIEHIRALARHRGHSIGVSDAEAFMILRSIA